MGETERQTDRDRETGRQTGIVFFLNFLFQRPVNHTGSPKDRNKTGRQTETDRQTCRQAGTVLGFSTSCQPHRVTSGQDKDRQGGRQTVGDRQTVTSEQDKDRQARIVPGFQRPVNRTGSPQDQSKTDRQADRQRDIVVGFQRSVNRTGSPQNKTKTDRHSSWISTSCQPHRVTSGPDKDRQAGRETARQHERPDQLHQGKRPSQRCSTTTRLPGSCGKPS